LGAATSQYWRVTRITAIRNARPRKAQYKLSDAAGLYVLVRRAVASVATRRVNSLLIGSALRATIFAENSVPTE
jgi:hypothetical protein